MTQVLSDALRAHVWELSGRIGERHPGRPLALCAARDYIRRTLTAYGYDVRLHPYQALGTTFENLEAVLPGSWGPQAPRIVVGAHYDTVPGTPGADDNASGIAGVLELARLSRGSFPRKSLHFAAFSTEEAPCFATDLMGSRFYAREARRSGDPIEGMVCLEMIGFYSKRLGLQSYPPLLGYFYPETADFIALVGNLSSRAFLSRVREGLRSHMRLPLEHATLPAWVHGVDLSDHRSFWKEGFPAVMLTDTAFYRNPGYHGPGDSYDTLDYDSMAALVEGLSKTLADLCR